MKRAGRRDRRQRSRHSLCCVAGTRRSVKPVQPSTSISSSGRSSSGSRGSISLRSRPSSSVCGPIDDQFAVGKLRFGGGVAFPREALKEIALLARQRPQPLARVQRLLDGLGKRGARRLPLLGGNEQRSVRRRQAALRRWRRVHLARRLKELALLARQRPQPLARVQRLLDGLGKRGARRLPLLGENAASSTGRRGDGSQAPTLVPTRALSAVRRRRTAS